MTESTSKEIDNIFARSANETRMYCMVNMYMSGIHAGIQSAHAVVEVMNGNPFNTHLRQWASTDKTMIVLDGGGQENLYNLHAEMCQYRSKCPSSGEKFPFAKFHEASWSLNEALTCVAIVLPDWMYKCKVITEGDGAGRAFVEHEGELILATHLYKAEFDLLRKIKVCNLKRG